MLRADLSICPVTAASLIFCVLSSPAWKTSFLFTTQTAGNLFTRLNELKILHSCLEKSTKSWAEDSVANISEKVKQ